MRATASTILLACLVGLSLAAPNNVDPGKDQQADQQVDEQEDQQADKYDPFYHQNGMVGLGIEALMKRRDAVDI
ncbi:hypothetical protein XA68_14510 [Ophiocordyceps unilateralis]|uniref:Uncharacterized protein n=1 Tax=Ophiocordyceps unilateralis TaxID=268505 RepID=A0A2A9PMF2_OPHUN|nr:hypothetical protein XA68_14510 [Ophiocordyceps unilateralis]